MYSKQCLWQPLWMALSYIKWIFKLISPRPIRQVNWFRSSLCQGLTFQSCSLIEALYWNLQLTKCRGVLIRPMRLYKVQWRLAIRLTSRVVVAVKSKRKKREVRVLTKRSTLVPAAACQTFLNSLWCPILTKHQSTCTYNSNLHNLYTRQLNKALKLKKLRSCSRPES